MKNDFYQKALAAAGIKCFAPNDDDKQRIQNMISVNLINGIFLEKDRRMFKNICNAIVEKEGIDGIILGCTEIPLLIKSDDFNIPVLDTMEIHIQSILERIV
jgi:aspartate racemase